MMRTAVMCRLGLSSVTRSAVAPSLRAPCSWMSTRRFTPDHEWVSVQDGVGTVGITDYAQKALGDVVYVEFPKVGDSLSKKDVLGAVESVKAASDIYAPVSGEVVDVNAALEGEPALINGSAFDKGWIAKIKLSNASELESMMDEAGYKKHIDSL